MPLFRGTTIGIGDGGLIHRYTRRKTLIRVWILSSVTALLCLTAAHSQIPYPSGPALIDGWLHRTDLVVIGTLRVKWCFPWLDGWHCSGSIQTEEVLFGDGNRNGSLSLRWIESHDLPLPCSTPLSRFGSQRGIWFLSSKAG
jgi:hypothetical protein